MKQDVIGFFDSGVGGLSIWRAVIAKLSHVDTMYIADQKYLPYGEKSEKEIQQRALLLTQYLISKGATLIVVACNSATVAAITMLRNNFDVPFVGVEPAIKTAVKLTKTNEITVLSTSTTKKSKRQTTLLTSYAKNTKVYLHAAPEFVELVENGELDTKEAQRVIDKYFHNTYRGNSDILVLGCTHYPFLEKGIRKSLGNGMKIIESSRPVARQVARIKQIKISDVARNIGRHHFYSTGDPSSLSDILQKLTSRKEKAEQLFI